MCRSIILAVFVASSLGSAIADGKVESYTFRPEKRPFRPDLVQQLKVPEGFEITVFATNLQNARMMIRGPEGQIYLSRYNQGDVLMLQDVNGRAGNVATVAKIENVHGLALRDRTLFLASDKKLLRAALKPDGTLETPREFAELPDGGQHPRRTIGFDRNGLLYVSIGSTCNSCAEANPEHASMLRMNADGSSRTIFARGLRNTIGFDWHPETGELWGFDHGSDDRGNDQPPEELNRLLEGRDYGWPYCFGKKVVDPLTQPPQKGPGKEERCAQSEGSVLEYQAHSAPIAFVFYNAEQFPPDFRGDGFVPFRGSWNRKPATGYAVARVHFENGKPVKIDEFVTGFLIGDGAAQFGRPAGLVITRDAALLISDDDNGTIYRVSYGRQAGRRDRPALP